ncbi:hypothetical protein FHS74_001653 [Nitrospirillum iridis]|uniref:Uncharacterized protein n=1 Tax=Nitrospirillum iridis TaxID=765888 RepID=A0A7X0AVY5_9PROT|nr:hypothetical protein [Nitrospirillum iridis]
MVLGHSLDSRRGQTGIACPGPTRLPQFHDQRWNETLG